MSKLAYDICCRIFSEPSYERTFLRIFCVGVFRKENFFNRPVFNIVIVKSYLAPSLDFSASFNIPNNNKRKTGWNPTTTKKFLFDLFVEQCNENYEIEQEDGTFKLVKGVQLIDDIGLLEEIINWAENLNVDRITSAMGAYGYAHYLRSSLHWIPKAYKKSPEKEETPKPQPIKKIQHFNQGRRLSHFRQRR